MIDEHTLTTLEFGKVRDRIASYASSVLGREEVERMMPMYDIARIREEFRPVFELTELISFDDPVPIRGIRDIRSAVERGGVEGAILQPEDFLHLKDTLSAARRLRNYLVKRKEKAPWLAALAEPISLHPDLEDAIDRTLDQNGAIRDSASPELAKIRRGILRARERLGQHMESILKGLPSEVIQDRIVTLREGRFVIPVRESQRRRVEGIIHDQSASGATVFIEPLAIVEMNNTLRRLELQEKWEIERILRELTDRVREIRRELEEDLHTLARLDGLYARAVFAVDFDAIAPALNEEGRIALRRARHPILVQRFRERGGEQDVTALDVHLGDAFTTLIITGPNAGGKTVALKTIGLLVLMAQAGFPIPADAASEVGVFRQVFADIGDEQSIENDLSTFSSHVKELVKVVRGADDRTLVLLDEIGASTDPDEGGPLAMAILERLIEHRARTVATTHHGALKAFAHERPGMENASMQFDGDTLTPTFRLRLGVPGSSYAFEIARRLGMPEEIVARASEYTGDAPRRMEDLIFELERHAQEYDEELRAIERTRGDAEERAREYEEKLRGVREEREQLRRDAVRQSKQILREANALIERTVAEIRTSGASADAIKRGRAAVQRALREAEEQVVPQREVQDPTEVRPGDIVMVQSFGREGKVLEERTSSGRVLVEVGKVRVEMSPSELQVTGKAAEPEKRSPSSGWMSVPNVSPELHVRGMTFAEAVPLVDKYLDDAFLAHLNTATIIHGKGTGALRTKIGNFLRTHPRVKSYRLGEWNEGGSGVTVVELSTDTD